jgi:hypothetical protein
MEGRGWIYRRSGQRVWLYDTGLGPSVDLPSKTGLRMWIYDEAMASVGDTRRGGNWAVKGRLHNIAISARICKDHETRCNALR